VGKSWRVDETYIKIKGKWRYLYRAVDKAGATVDLLLRAHREKAAAQRYFVGPAKFSLRSELSRGCGLSANGNQPVESGCGEQALAST